MDRHLLSTNELVHQVIAELRPFAEILPPQDRQVFNEFTEYALNNHAAIADAASLLPLEGTLLVLLLEEHRRCQQLYDVLCTEIERLKEATEQLKETAQAGANGP